MIADGQCLSLPLACSSAALAWSSLAYWLVSSPLVDHDASRTLSDAKPALEPVVGARGVGAVEVPALKVRPPPSLSLTLPRALSGATGRR